MSRQAVNQLAAIGSIEGTLLVISAVKGFKFGVQDVLTGKVVCCEFDDQCTDAIADLFNKRIVARGWIKYRPDREIAKIQVESYRLLREANQLPSAEDVRGILKLRKPQTASTSRTGWRFMRND